MKHEQWFFTPEQGAAVPSEELYLVPVDPVLYKMRDIWGYDHEELPCEPFDIEIKIQSENVLEGLKIFESAVKGAVQTRDLAHGPCREISVKF